MKVLLYGATGMVGQGVLLECVKAADVNEIVAVGRRSSGFQSPKTREIVVPDMLNYGDAAAQLRGFDACFFCLGVSSTAVSAEEYEQITYGFTIAAAEVLVESNPQVTFCYVSGAGTDSTERGSTRWARVKGRTENALLKTFANAYMFRPGFIEAMDGIESRTRLYNSIYKLVRPLMPLVRRILGDKMLDTRQIGRALLQVARSGFQKRILEIDDIRMAAQVR